ncbi:MAG: hypothetical protein AAFY56_21335 [Pseudomonadota bacterium]
MVKPFFAQILFIIILPFIAGTFAEAAQGIAADESSQQGASKETFKKDTTIESYVLSRLFEDRLRKYLVNSEFPLGAIIDAPLEDVLDGEAEWETLVDFQEIPEIRNKNWKLQDAKCRGSQYRTCLIKFHDPVSMQSLWREFSIKDKTLVANSFSIPAGADQVSWIDKDHLIIGVRDPDIQNSDETTVNVVFRGKPFSAANQVFKGTGVTIAKNSYSRLVVLAVKDSEQRTEIYKLERRRRLTKIADAPASADFIGVMGNGIFFQLREDWTARVLVEQVTDYSISGDSALDREETEKLDAEEVIGIVLNGQRITAIESILRPKASRTLRAATIGSGVVYFKAEDDGEKVLLKSYFRNGRWAPVEYRFDCFDFDASVVPNVKDTDALLLSPNCPSDFYLEDDRDNPTFVAITNTR